MVLTLKYLKDNIYRLEDSSRHRLPNIWFSGVARESHLPPIVYRSAASEEVLIALPDAKQPHDGDTTLCVIAPPRTVLINNWRGEPCKASWAKFGKERRLRAVIKPDMEIVSALGVVKLKNDGRWEWRLIHKTDGTGFFRGSKAADKIQGVCDSENKAMEVIEAFWGALPPSNPTSIAKEHSCY